MPTKLEQLQLQFRQRLMQEKEERMIKIHTDSQQKALNKVLRYDSNASTSAAQTTTLPSSGTGVIRKPATISPGQAHASPTKKSSPGVDRSRPLPPINREPRNGNNNRINVSASSGDSYSPSSSSSSSIRVPAHNNGTRSRSLDAENDRANAKTGVRMKQRTDSVHGAEAHRYNGHSTNGAHERKSSESDAPKARQQDIHRAKAKASFDSPPKVTNGHQTALRSSAEPKTMAGSSKIAPATGGTAQGRKPKTMATVVARKSVNSRGAAAAMPVKGKPSSQQPLPRKPPNPNQEQCHYCGRNFNKDRIEKHSSICAKASQKKVKVFDATKMRVKGTEAESFVKKRISTDPPKPKKSNWKKQHEEFINAIRQAKIAQRHLAAGGKLSDLPPPPPSDTSSYVPCPYCGRKFDEGVAQRHIPKCKNILSNKKTAAKKK